MGEITMFEVKKFFLISYYQSLNSMINSVANIIHLLNIR
jgi:hypothetical protein